MGEARDVSVVLVEATVLGDLSGASGIDNTLNGAHDNVWHCWVFCWVAKTLGDQLRAVDDVLDP